MVVNIDSCHETGFEKVLRTVVVEQEMGASPPAPGMFRHRCLCRVNSNHSRSFRAAYDVHVHLIVVAHGTVGFMSEIALSEFYLLYVPILLKCLIVGDQGKKYFCQ